MCQLVGYVGDRPIAPLILKALELQEPYFGAHATGIGVLNNGKLRIIKGSGHVAKVKRTTRISELKGTTGIGHSRYSSLAREDPRFDTAAMAHPFTNDGETIALMHNGNITNFKEHWARLRGSHTFKSYNPDIDWITDSEVAVHMVSEAVAAGEGFEEALKDVMPRCTGNVLLCLVSQEEPETIYLANRHQPCYVGLGGDEVMWCSSRVGLEPLEGELNRIYQPPKNSLMKLTRGKVKTMVLDPNWKVPELKLDKEFLKEAIVNILSYGDSDFADLKDALNHNLLARAYGKNQDEWAEMRRNGVDIVNPYIETLNELIEEGRIRQRIDPRLEGGTPNTPRFAYSLA
jgi:glucosamine 6-phosphate synthetase-like amidotransferase/phosphosugar isomerase protein